MPDTTSHKPAPSSWNEAFAALPPETPPSGGWNRVATKLDERRPARSRAPVWLATAAAILVVVALPWRMQWFAPHSDGATPSSMPAQVAAADPLEALYAESAQLESLLAVARDDTMSTGTAAALASELDVQVVSIDAALMQPGLSRDERLSLWEQRVDSLRMLTTFESNRRWLAAQGTQYDAAIARID